MNTHEYTTLYSTKITFCVMDCFSKFYQIRRKLQVCSHLLKKSLTENFIFCVIWSLRSRRQTEYGEKQTMEVFYEND